ncbi:phosphatase PAP2 family protein [uncultured Microbacterium sp.]|jgi:membrane-associated phospholipid phosphatase|nr:phosphatase PAP2 family protein [uncultured Microbacterium sp.]
MPHPTRTRLPAPLRRAAAEVHPYTALLLTLVIGGLLAYALSWLTEEVYDSVAAGNGEGIAGIDRPALDVALTLRSPVVDTVVTLFTDLAGPIVMPIIAAVAALVLGLRRRSWTPVILIVAAGVGSLLMTVAGKQVIGRERPPLEQAVPPYEYTPSFPSGHTLNAVVVVGVIAYLLILRRRTRGAKLALGIGAAAFAVLVGLSRAFLGHHWLTDVIAGWLLGGAWLAVVITAHRASLVVRDVRASRGIHSSE